MVNVVFSDEPITDAEVTELVREGVYKKTNYEHYRNGEPYVYYYQSPVSNPLSLVYGDNDGSLSSEEEVTLELADKRISHRHVMISPRTLA